MAGVEDLEHSTAYLQHLNLSRAQPQEPAPTVTNLQELAMLISEKPGMWARQWESEGRQKGLQEGRQEGRLEGLREGRLKGRQEGLMEGKAKSATTILEKQLQRKFGAIPDWAALRMAQADADTLQQWALNILDAEQVEDVFK